MIYIVVPTFKETPLVKNFIYNFNNCIDLTIIIILVNANPYDETTQFLQTIKLQNESTVSIVEIFGNPNEYWSASVNRGFEYAKKNIKESDYLILCNIDIDFNYELFYVLQDHIVKHNHNSILAPISIISNGKVKSSGVKITNWFLDGKIHPFAGVYYNDINLKEEMSVDFLATRLIMIPYKAFVLNWKINDKILPHYAADYDYTRKFHMLGYKLYLVPKCSIKVNSDNTGLSIYGINKSNVFTRLHNLFNIKNPGNPIYRLIFIYRNYPYYAILSVSLINLIKLIIETLLGGKLVKKFFKMKQRGIS